ncbi:MAG: quinol:electron acceptor oxidoreductase subunit ActD [Acidobacteriota bacterium]
MTETILAAFATHEDALEAARALRREGLREIELMSSEPIHEAMNGDSSKSLITWFTIAGGITGATAAILLTVLTSRHVNIVTGGMPVVSFWAFGVIIFETAMFTAVLFALGRMLYEARLFGGSPVDYDEAVSDDKVVMAVRCSDEASVNTAKTLLNANNATLNID